MKRISKALIGIAIAVLMLMAGCVSTKVSDGTLGVTPEDDGNFTAGIIYTDDAGMPHLDEGFGIKGSDATFDGVYAGYSATIPLTLVNGHDKARQFVVSSRIPSKVADGFEPIPWEYLDWILVLEPTANLAIGEIYQVPVTLSIPEDTELNGERYEVRILVEDIGQTGLVQIAVDMKWFIIAR